MKFHNIPEDLFSSKVKLAVMKLLMRHPSKKFSGRELSRLVGLSPSRTLEILNYFQKYGIITKITLGRTSAWSLNAKSFLISELISLIDIDRKAIDSLTASLRKALVKDKRILRAVLYGSIVQKTERPDSDIDLFVLVKEDSDKADVEEKVHKLNISFIPRYGNAISEIIYSKGEYEKKKFLELVRQIESSGVVLFKR